MKAERMVGSKAEMRVVQTVVPSVGSKVGQMAVMMAAMKVEQTAETRVG